MLDSYLTSTKQGQLGTTKTNGTILFLFSDIWREVDRTLSATEKEKIAEHYFFKNLNENVS